jgi:hypothetical protein
MAILQMLFTGNAPRDFRKISASLSSWARAGMSDVAAEASIYIKNNYLRGQSLEYRTGLTFRSLKQFYVKSEKTWYIRPGVGVKGSQNYLAKWVDTSREFMKPGFRRYLQHRNASEKVRDMIGRGIM